ncbi:hypothetical protein ATO6_00635 [Oceanicola sp. 22II-s10i]|uniref:DUF6455 family protein n=1 Tax=Oceanicola sp. 22II-s10i TaxID=1317116 RepID=UPI000B52166D|nr:DUF6455 family protein [Oceanicola sp. 22II-s10i]OWU85492.1 hypothetical protein ATO6_00635 [Oceanicola sp. 22II-s10i]
MGFLSYFQRLDRAGRLFNGMADRMGVDVRADNGSEAGVAAYRGALMRCANCARPETCAGWQVEHHTAAAPPDYCRNRDVLEAMMRS